MKVLDFGWEGDKNLIWRGKEGGGVFKGRCWKNVGGFWEVEGVSKVLEKCLLNVGKNVGKYGKVEKIFDGVRKRI